MSLSLWSEENMDERDSGRRGTDSEGAQSQDEKRGGKTEGQTDTQI